LKVAKYSWDSKLILTGGDDAVVRLWQDRAVVAECRGHTSCILALHISKDSQLVCSSAFDKTCRVWRADGTPLKTLKFSGLNGETDYIFRGCSFTQEGSLVTLQTGSRGPSAVTLWSKGFLPVSHMQVSPDASCLLAVAGRAVAVGTNEGEVQMFRVSCNSVQFEYKRLVFDLPVTCMAFNETDTRVVVGSANYGYAYLPVRHRYSVWTWTVGVVLLSWLCWYVLRLS
jgi:WD40 repeat protein